MIGTIKKGMRMLHSVQSGVIAFLSDPASYGSQEPIEIVETHISIIFLAGKRAYKLKKAVKLPYVDFSSPSRRRDACLKEVELNARTAPDVYIGVKRLSTNQTGQVCFAEEGPLVDAVIEMVRFNQDHLFDHLASADKLTDPLMTETARMIVHFHEAAPVVRGLDGCQQMESVLDINEAGFKASTVFKEEEIDALNRLFRDALEQHAERLRMRAETGKIRRCHGDLHLRNIVLLDGQPRLFDCIEFNDQIATVDVLYDLAFLLMDLWHEGHNHHANLVMNRYFDDSDNEDGFALLSFFLAVRSAVRAHVIATQAEGAEAGKAELCSGARSYFNLARTLLETQPARLVAIGGLSGSGKTSVAEAVAPRIGPPPGARIVESDRVRKAMHGVPAETRLPKAAYRPEVSKRVYAEIMLRTQVILSDGGCVVADAVFDRADHRQMIEAVAAQKHVRFKGFWLDADPALLWQRVHARQGGPSDANVDVLQNQLTRQTGVITWHRIDVSKSLNQCCAGITAILASECPG
jgi:uncharacterized protein